MKNEIISSGRSLKKIVLVHKEKGYGFMDLGVTRVLIFCSWMKAQRKLANRVRG